MTALTAFDFEDTPVRAFEREDGTIWFVAADVCAALDVKNTSQAVAALDPDERAMFNIGRQGETNVISEGGPAGGGLDQKLAFGLVEDLLRLSA